jgi:phospholipid/cholesterol/gamma-HCH transport system ATP-binding protein
LARQKPHEQYVAVLFSIKDFQVLVENTGHDAAQGIIRDLGAYINKHFGAVGGFSARQTINEIGTVLPFSDMNEAKRILRDFVTDLHEHGLTDFRPGGDSLSDNCFEFSILAGLSEGRHQVELESIMEFARYNQKEVVRFVCDNRKM